MHRCCKSRLVGGFSLGFFLRFRTTAQFPFHLCKIYWDWGPQARFDDARLTHPITRRFFLTTWVNHRVYITAEGSECSGQPGWILWPSSYRTVSLITSCFLSEAKCLSVGLADEMSSTGHLLSVFLSLHSHHVQSPSNLVCIHTAYGPFPTPHAGCKIAPPCVSCAGNPTLPKC